jgi:hypothetical protein
LHFLPDWAVFSAAGDRAHLAADGAALLGVADAGTAAVLVEATSSRQCSGFEIGQWSRLPRAKRFTVGSVRRPRSQVASAQGARVARPSEEIH